MSGAESLIGGADRATAAGDLRAAEQLLRDAVEAAPDDLTIHLKLAAIQRATGQLSSALSSVNRALAINPLDFTSLLLRATLLDRLGHPDAAEAFSHALAQRPDGELPPHLQSVVASAEARVESWTSTREDRMKAAMAHIEGNVSEDERWRLQRFRSNVLRRTRAFHSEPTHFHYPGLAEREYFPRVHFPWLTELEEAADTIRMEFESLMATEGADLVPYIQYADHLPLDQWRELNRNRDWSAIHLIKNGELVPANANACPKTLAILKRVTQPRIRGASPNAMFSLLAPRTSIPPHVGVNNTRLVCHLPLVVPEGCWFRVGAETRFWKEGEAFVFDDTIEHEAANPTDQLRAVFIFDTWHPQLSTTERDAITALIETDGVPGTF